MSTVAQPVVATEGSAKSRRMVGELSRAGRRQRRLRLVCGILAPALLFVLWEVTSRAGWLDAHFFPAPSTVLVNATQFVTEPQMRADLLDNLGHSAVRLGVGFGLGSLAGLSFGLLMGLIPVVRYSLSAVINATYPLPKLALYPLMIIFFGIGNTSMTALVTLGVFFMVCINTVSGVTYSPAIYRDMATAFRVPRWTRLVRVTIPAAIPSVIGGLRLGFGQALIIVISTEMVGGQNGIGYMIWNSWQVLNVSEMFVGLAIVGLVGWLGSMAITGIARVAVPWEND